MNCPHCKQKLEWRNYDMGVDDNAPAMTEEMWLMDAFNHLTLATHEHVQVWDNQHRGVLEHLDECDRLIRLAQDKINYVILALREKRELPDYPGLDPDTQKAYEEIRAGVNIGKKDPRCDGCIYQHPFMENIIIDEINGVVMCRRNVNQHYIKDGMWVKGFGKGQGLMVCEVYRLRDIDNELVRI